MMVNTLPQRVQVRWFSERTLARTSERILAETKRSIAFEPFSGTNWR
jgi:hypothetical protein